jgi:hypothetical protein
MGWPVSNDGPAEQQALQASTVQLLWTFCQPAGPMLLMLVMYAQAVQYIEQHHILHDEC